MLPTWQVLILVKLHLKAKFMEPRKTSSCTQWFRHPLESPTWDCRCLKRQHVVTFYNVYCCQNEYMDKLLTKLKHTPNIPACCGFVGCHIVASRTMKIPPLLQCLHSVFFQVSYFTTGSLPPISLSWHEAPWDPWPEISFHLNSCSNTYVASSLTGRRVCHEYAWLFVRCTFHT
jgi:hypothetical protein